MVHSLKLKPIINLIGKTAMCCSRQKEQFATGCFYHIWQEKHKIAVFVRTPIFPLTAFKLPLTPSELPKKRTQLQFMFLAS